jgi:hypothetical protein
MHPPAHRPGRPPVSVVIISTVCAGTAVAGAWALASPPGLTAAPDEAPVPVVAVGRGQIAGSGSFAVGDTIRPGTYRSEGPAVPASYPGCTWTVSEDTSDSQDSVLATGTSNGPVTVTVPAAAQVFRTAGCRPWTRLH